MEIMQSDFSESRIVLDKVSFFPDSFNTTENFTSLSSCQSAFRLMRYMVLSFSPSNKVMWFQGFCDFSIMAVLFPSDLDDPAKTEDSVQFR